LGKKRPCEVGGVIVSILDEEVIRISEVPDLPFMRGRGNKVSLATLWRWVNNGLKGVRLETVKIGGTRCTSVQAVQRFIRAHNGGASVEVRTPARRLKERERAKVMLTSEGI
jgi:hypothetical protein